MEFFPCLQCKTYFIRKLAEGVFVYLLGPEEIEVALMWRAPFEAVELFPKITQNQ